MNTKTLLAALVGAVVLFLLGFIVYGMLIPEDFLKKNYFDGVMRGKEEMNFPLLIVSNLIWGLFIAIILGWSNASSFSSGAMKSGIAGILIAAAYSIGYLGMSNLYVGNTGVILDIIGTGAMAAIAGGVVGWMLGRGNTAAA